MFAIGFNDNIYTIKVIFLKCPILLGFFSLLECKKRKSRYHGKRKNGNVIKRKIGTEKRINTSLKHLSVALNDHGQHG